jgi:hypothetical protein
MCRQLVGDVEHQTVIIELVRVESDLVAAVVLAAKKKLSRRRRRGSERRWGGEREGGGCAKHVQRGALSVLTHKAGAELAGVAKEHILLYLKIMLHTGI